MLTDLKEFAVLAGLLDEALEVPPDKREQWLGSLRPEAAAYEERLRSLLGHAGTARTEDFLQVSSELRIIAGAYAAVRGTKLASGSPVGPYVVEQEIASGGMGSVWLARRSDGVIKRPVALKLPHPGPMGRSLIERFERERNILAQLTHPNIAGLYDAGFSGDGQPYLALEYVAGAPITVYCDEQRLNIRQRLQLFQQVLHAVQYAHSNLIIHRDVKPSNVIVGHDGRAMLLDFVISKLISTEATDNNPRTQFGLPTLALTPEYASPEQITGQSIEGKGTFIVDANATFVGLDVAGATGDGIGAAFRHQSGDLTVRRTKIHRCENGLLGPAHYVDCVLVVDDCDVFDNATGTGQTHGLYVGEIASFTCVRSRFRATNIGHHIKSRARRTTLRNCQIGTDFNGNESYNVDVPQAGDVTVVGCHLRQGPRTDNAVMLNFAGERNPHPGGSLTVSDTVFESTAGGTGIRIHLNADVVAHVANCEFKGVDVAVEGRCVMSNCRQDGRRLPDGLQSRRSAPR